MGLEKILYKLLMILSFLQSLRNTVPNCHGKALGTPLLWFCSAFVGWIFLILILYIVQSNQVYIEAVPLEGKAS